MSDTLFVIDGSGFIFRAYYGIRMPMKSVDGENVHAVYGFIKMLYSLLKTYKPSHLAIAFDPNEPSFRNDIYPPYKSNRPSPPEDLPAQYALCIEATKCFNIPALSCSKMEADDVIGTLVKQWAKKAVVVSSDKDMSQLVNADVSLWDGKDGAFLDRNGVKEKMGVFPEQIIDYLGIAGDASDHIPGVPGIGPKGAIQLLEEYGDLESILANAHQVKGKKGEALTQFADQARLSARLATIKLDAPLEYNPALLSYQGPDETRLADFLSRMRFKSIASELGLSLKPTAKKDQLQKAEIIDDLFSTIVQDQPAKQSNQSNQSNPSNPSNPSMVVQYDLFSTVEQVEQKALNHYYAKLDDLKALEKAELQKDKGQSQRRFEATPIQLDRSLYQSIFSEEALDQVILEISKEAFFCVDLETTSLDPYKAEIVGIALCWAPQKAVYIPLAHAYLGVPQQLPADFVWQKLKPLFISQQIGKIGQNIKFEMKIFEVQKIDVNHWIGDTMLMAYLLESDRDHYDLNQLSKDYLDYKDGLSFKQVVGKSDFSFVEVEQATAYSAEDADLTFRLYQYFLPKLKADPQLDRLYTEIELPLSKVLAKMELSGVCLDVTLLQQQQQSIQEEIQKIQQQIYALASCEFNLDSPIAVGQILYEKLKLKPAKKKSQSTKFEFLDAISDQHPIVKLILDYRHVAKLKNTYLDALPKLINPKTQRVHTSFKQTGTVTGRLSSSDPNLQNIPTKTQQGKQIREAFIAKEGYVLISADYSQVELRLLAHFAKAKQMINAFKHGADIHKQTASDMFHVPIDQVSTDQRRQAKAINFGLMYGMGATKLGHTLGIPTNQAKSMIDLYFKKYQEVQNFVQNAVEEVRIKHYSSTLMGRKRYLADIDSSHDRDKSQAERLALNTPIQGTAADILKLAMVQLDALLEEKFPKTHILLTVHDELLLEVPKEDAKAVGDLVKRVMENAYPLDLPLDVEVGVGANWADIH